LSSSVAAAMLPILEAVSSAAWAAISVCPDAVLPNSASRSDVELMDLATLAMISRTPSTERAKLLMEFASSSERALAC